MVGKICPMGGSVLTPDLNATSENFLKGHSSLCSFPGRSAD